MFSRDSSVSIKASASSLCNNLTVLSSKEKQSLTYGVVHKAFVCITTVTKGTVVNQKQVSCKGEGAHSSSAVLQVFLCFANCYTKRGNGWIHIQCTYMISLFTLASFFSHDLSMIRIDFTYAGYTVHSKIYGNNLTIKRSWKLKVPLDRWKVSSGVRSSLHLDLKINLQI